MGLVEHHDVVLGQDRTAARHVEPVQVGVDDDHVGRGGALAGLLGEARITQRAAIGAGTLVAADADRPPGVVRRRPVQLGHVAGRRRPRPLREPLDLDLGLHRHRLEFELALVAAAHLAQTLQAHVVAAPLQHRPVEVHAEVLGEERQVLGGELILQRLGRGGDHDASIGLDRGHEVGERLAGAGSGLDHQMSLAGDRVGDERRHLPLSDAVLGIGEGRGDPAERVAHRASASAASSSTSSKSGQAASVK